MATITPEKPAPTKGEVANVLRIRDEIARIVGKARTSPVYGARNEKASAALSQAITERLIEAGYVDFESVHRSIIDGNDELEDDDEPDELLLD